ncbi:MAG TPA: lipid-A-disaccharide synthase [Cyclobacteriaceae bacterium]|nr:lipid-A-disaccharide synthase [Cyclobacteriaceae bacterium]
MRYYIIAGERSGDLHGGNLVKALRKYDPQGDFRGFGGEYMKESGVDLAVHYGEMAFMGMTELLANLGKIRRYIRNSKLDIEAYKPDVLILIDYGGFNRRIAKYGRRRGIRVFYYIPPKVWAWHQNRAWELKSNVDKLFVILPFEKTFYKRFNWEVDYVGSPVLDAVRAHQADESFLERENLLDERPLVALLPGSRRHEVELIVPVMAEVARKNPKYLFVVASVDNLEPPLYAGLRALTNVRFVNNKTYDLLRHSKAAVVTSGTATLETALFNVPQIVVYRASYISYLLAKMVIRVPFISLVNLIADREVVREFIQGEAKESVITAELRQLVDGDRREIVKEGYREIVGLLDTGSSASDNAAKLMVNYLEKG